jgi:hypothetical protein
MDPLAGPLTPTLSLRKTGIPEWIICEKNGRWTAALRVALARGGTVGTRDCIQEVRNLTELTAAARDMPTAMVLLEVHPESFGPALNWLFEGWHRGAQAVALLGAGFPHDHHTDSLLEAGALAVVNSPRRLSRVLGLATKVAVSRRALAKKYISAEIVAERAWASLPWQDT